MLTYCEGEMECNSVEVMRQKGDVMCDAHLLIDVSVYRVLDFPPLGNAPLEFVIIDLNEPYFCRQSGHVAPQTLPTSPRYTTVAPLSYVRECTAYLHTSLELGQRDVNQGGSSGGRTGVLVVLMRRFPLSVSWRTPTKQSAK